MISRITELLERITKLKELQRTCRVEAGSKYYNNPVIASLQKELDATVAAGDHVGAVTLQNRLNKAASECYARDIRDCQIQIVKICKDIYTDQKHLIDRCDARINTACLKQLANLDHFDDRFVGIVGFFTRLQTTVPKYVIKSASAVGSLISKFEN
jgi:hypothetical protein